MQKMNWDHLLKDNGLTWQILPHKNTRDPWNAFLDTVKVSIFDRADEDVFRVSRVVVGPVTDSSGELSAQRLLKTTVLMFKSEPRFKPLMQAHQQHIGMTPIL